VRARERDIRDNLPFRRSDEIGPELGNLRPAATGDFQTGLDGGEEHSQEGQVGSISRSYRQPALSRANDLLLRSSTGTNPDFRP
jgi:hypothetical protein